MDPNVPLDIRFSCPECDTELILPRESHVNEGPCPRCGATIRAPEPPRCVLPPRRSDHDRAGSPGFLKKSLDDVLTPGNEW